MDLHKEFKYEDRTVGAILEHKARTIGEKYFLLHEDLRVTYKEMNENTNKIANSLLRLGVKKGDKVCMIGGWDQFHYFTGCSEEETRAAVRRCFQEAGENGGFILTPSDHFFDADLNLIAAYADEARHCSYS